MQLLMSLVEEYGLWLVFFNVLALQLGLPTPAYPTLILVGALALDGSYAPPQVIAIAVAASLIADLVWYAAGARFGRRVLRLMCRISLSPDSCVSQTESIYERWGSPSLMFAKFVPGFAAVATSMAGVLRTRLTSFVFFDAIGALLWSGVGVSLGWIFHDAVGDVVDVFLQAGRWGLIALASALLLYVAAKALQRYRLIRTLRMERVSVDELHGMIAREERPLIIDVRSPASRGNGRIPGAVWIDSHAFDDSMSAAGLPTHPASEVIVYCACPNEASAAAIAKRLMRAGFKRVRPLAGGIEAWIEKGYDVVASDT